MNKAEVVRKVAERSGVSEQECESVIDALEKVLQDELGTGVMSKLSGVMQFFSQKN